MKQAKCNLIFGMAFLMAFGVWTALILYVDVRHIGVSGTSVGLSALNGWFHSLTGVRMWLYTLTDWLGLVPIAICTVFGAMGLLQWIGRRRLLLVDHDILLLGIYYILVITGYLVFESIPVHYRPILIDGRMEASYPSSTTLLTLGVMPTLVFEVKRRVSPMAARRVICFVAWFFCAFVVMGRLLSGVHWLCDIVGASLLSMGLYCLFVAATLRCDEKV